jgi:hypothetical protein
LNRNRRKARKPTRRKYEQDIGPADDRERTALNIQVVVPFDLNKDWNIISRTNLPVRQQQDSFSGAGDNVLMSVTE